MLSRRRDFQIEGAAGAKAQGWHLTWCNKSKDELLRQFNCSLFVELFQACLSNTTLPVLAG